MDKLPKEARGSFVWTLLQGKALEVVEHLKPEQYQVAGGETVLFDLLDKRWPEIEQSTELGENINKVFTIRAQEGESLRQWCARAGECFDSCSRKSGVKFPEEAKGWILLNCGGLTSEQRAVILARAQGDLRFDEVSRAMRSCFPDFVVPKKRTAAINLVEETEVDSHADRPTGPSDGDFNDVEIFLSEHGFGPSEDDPRDSAEVAFDEDEVAEVLASTWKEKRAELNRLQKGRRFQQASEVRRSFRVDVEELKRRTKCRRCGKIGHWQKECRSQAPVASSSTSTASGSKGGSKGLGAGSVENVEHFICVASPQVTTQHTMVEQLVHRRQSSVFAEVCLVSSPGYAVLDSGCGKTSIGAQTLDAFKSILLQKGVEVPDELTETNTFKYGNGETEVSHRAIQLPICIAGRRGVIHAAVVKGRAPLLMSRMALKTLGAEMNFGDDKLIVFPDRVQVPLTVNSAGQYAVDVSSFSEKVMPQASSEHTENVKVEPVPDDEEQPCASISINKPRGNKKKDYWELKVTRTNSSPPSFETP